jgi:hypothetical protein
MNYISNSKTAKISKDIVEIDRTIQERIFSLQDEEIRKLVDERRHLSSLLISMQEPNDQQSQSTQWYNIDPTVERLLDDWVEKVKKNGSASLDFTDNKFCGAFVDLALPKTWHFENDVIVIVDPPSPTIIENIISRGQRHIVVFADLTKSSKHEQKLKKAEHVQFCDDLISLERIFALLQSPAKQIITISCEPSSKGSKNRSHEIKTAIEAGKRTRHENTRTVSRFGKSWATNVLENIPNLQNAKNIHDLEIHGVEDAIIVASGPSLNKNISTLRNIQENVFIVSALRSLPVLEEAGVIPDIVLQLDAEDNEVAKNLAFDPNYVIKNFLLEPTVNPGFLKIPTHQLIWSLGQHFFDVHEKFGTAPTPFNVPSVSIYGLSLCHYLKFKNICFIGQDLAIDSGRQYAEGATNLLPAHAALETFNIEVPGFYGSTVMTRNSFEYQIKRCSEIAHEWQNKQPEIKLVNATEGGAFIDGFEHMSLAAYSKTRGLEKLSLNKKIKFKGNSCYSRADLLSYLYGIVDKMDNVISLASMIIKLDNSTHRSRGLNKKIQKAVKKFQRINDSTSILQIAMQDDISRVIGTSETTQNIGTFADFFTVVLAKAKQIKTVADLASKK